MILDLISVSFQLGLLGSCFLIFTLAGQGWRQCRHQEGRWWPWGKVQRCPARLDGHKTGEWAGRGRLTDSRVRPWVNAVLGSLNALIIRSRLQGKREG